MVAAPLADATTADNDTDNQPDLRRITEHDPALKRLKARTVRQLTQSVHWLVSDLRHGVPVEQAQSRFIQRHITLMRAAYEAAHEEGQRDYYGAVSRVPGKWIGQQAIVEATVAKRLAFYAPSVAKMAHEATEAWHQTQYESTITPALSDFRFPASQPHSDDGVMLLAGGIGEREDNLAKWQSSVGARITLQADLSWSGAQDGYVAAGFGDSANPYSTLWWDLEPVSQHCQDCPMFAAGSPYDPPWVVGGNTLNATPGDGNTQCGAACNCGLRYGGAVGATRTQDWKAWLPNGTPDVPDGPMQPVQPPAQRVPEQQQPPTNVPPSPFEPLPRRESAYGPMIPGGEFNAGQKAALDLYRLAELSWNKARGQLPELPNFFTLANPNFTWERFDYNSLTKAQQRALDMALQAFYRWGANTPPEWLDYYDDYDLRESDDEDVVALSNLYPRQKGGRFGFGPGKIARGKAEQATAARREAEKQYHATLAAHTAATDKLFHSAHGTAEYEKALKQSTKTLHAHQQTIGRMFSASDAEAHAHAKADELVGKRRVTVAYREGVEDGLKNFFGREVSRQEVASLVGAQHGDTVIVSQLNGGFHIELHGRGYSLRNDTGGSYEAKRFLDVNEHGQKSIHNNSFEVRQTGKGVGTRVFADQVRGASRMGITRIFTDAAGRGGEPGYNGYYTWARLGYNAHFGKGAAEFLPAEFRGARTIQQLMRMPGGAKWWKANGEQFPGEFNTRPGSVSRRVLGAYLKAKGIAK